MSNSRTGQDYIDYYESKEKTTMGEKLKYTKEKAKLRKQQLKDAMK
jgi:hypothetical protein